MDTLGSKLSALQKMAVKRFIKLCSRPSRLQKIRVLHTVDKSLPVFEGSCFFEIHKVKSRELLSTFTFVAVHATLK